MEEWISEKALNDLCYINKEKALSLTSNEQLVLNVLTIEKLSKIVPNENELRNLRGETPNRKEIFSYDTWDPYVGKYGQNCG